MIKERFTERISSPGSRIGGINKWQLRMHQIEFPGDTIEVLPHLRRVQETNRFGHVRKKRQPPLKWVFTPKVPDFYATHIDSSINRNIQIFINIGVGSENRHFMTLFHKV